MALHVTDCLTINELPYECIQDCTVPGQDATAAVQHWRELLGFTVDRDRAVKCVLGYGAWDADQLAAKGDDEIAEIILWLACGNFNEWDGTEESPCGSDIFCLE